jgi:alpha-glucosidase
MKYVIPAFLFFLLATVNCIAQTGTNGISSPDKTTSLEFKTVTSRLFYRVLYNGEEVITWSALGLQTNNQGEHHLVSLKRNSQKIVNTQFAWPLGEDAIIYNNYNEISLNCKGGAISYNLEARIYNGSVAFRYLLSRIPDSVTGIKKEETAFNFTRPTTLYSYNQESVFTPVAIDTFSKPCDLPATLTNDKFYVSIGEAGNLTYTKPELKRGNTA